MIAPANLFLAYSHLDSKFRHELEQHLKLLSRKGQVDWFGEHQIVPGDERLDIIDNKLCTADVILVLVSIHFLANEFCWSDMLEKAIARHDRKEALVIPIHVRSCPFEDTPIARLQGVPRDGRPIASWSDRHSAWTEVARGIQQAIEVWKGRKGSS